MKAPLPSLLLSSALLLLVLHASSAHAQSNSDFGDNCTLAVFAYDDHEVSGTCSGSNPNANPAPSSLTMTRSYECGNDCQVAASGSLSIHLVSDCRYNAPPGDGWTECTYAPGTEGYRGDLEYSISGHDGRWIGSQACVNGGRKEASVSCYHCGHPCDEPVLISLGDQEYQLTDLEHGVRFDLSGDGTLESLPWTASGSDDAFLVLDRNQNGRIDNGLELFSHVSPQPEPPEGEAPHGFRALAVFDDPLNGGNADGEISNQDAIFRHLRLWLDADHDGLTDAGELLGLDDGKLSSISLDYTDANEHLDAFGNIFKFSTLVEFTNDRNVDAWVVYFNLDGCSACNVVARPDDDTIE